MWTASTTKHQTKHHPYLKPDGVFPRIEIEAYSLALSLQEVAMPRDRAELETYSIDDVIRVPIVLRDEDGVAHVRAVFRRLRYAGELGPRGLDPNDTLELRGNGNGQQQATVELTRKVADEHEPGDYLCVSIQVYDTNGNVVIIKTPSPSRLFRVVDEGKRDDKKTEFLGWGD
jgi:hypothetical protein